MGPLPIISIAIAAVLVITGILLVYLFWKRRKDGQQIETNYRACFIMGVILLPIGIAIMIIYYLVDLSSITALPFVVLGLVYLIIGLKNRDKWKKKDGES
jgi:heme A synthase